MNERDWNERVVSFKTWMGTHDLNWIRRSFCRDKFAGILPVCIYMRCNAFVCNSFSCLCRKVSVILLHQHRNKRVVICIVWPEPNSLTTSAVPCNRTAVWTTCVSQPLKRAILAVECWLHSTLIRGLQQCSSSSRRVDRGPAILEHIPQKPFQVAHMEDRNTLQARGRSNP